MPPQIALLLCVLVVAVLLWRSGRHHPEVSNATWIPLVWMFIVGSRYLSQWLGEGTGADWAAAQADGSPIDRAIFLCLILAGIAVLSRRPAATFSILRRNKLLCLFFVLGLVSMVWSEYPLTSLKRWIKASGNLVMALLLLTEKNPRAAVGLVLTRLALLGLPLSLVFIKYFPELGRSIHHGRQLFNGVALHKNTLGQLCLLTGIYFSWSYVYRPVEWASRGRRLLLLSLLALTAWLLYMADSATSQVTLLLTVFLLIVSRTSPISGHPARLTAITVLLGLGFIGLQFLGDIASVVVSSVGRDPSLTTRVPMWDDLLGAPINAAVGSGYEAFWLTDFGQVMRLRWGVFQAHNGYLELYLSLGLVGLLLMIATMVVGFYNVSVGMVADHDAAILKLCFIVAVVVYNWTEATFYGPSNVWLVFLLGSMNAGPVSVPARSTAPQQLRSPALVWRATPGPRPVRPVSSWGYRRPLVANRGRRFAPRVSR